MNLNWYAKIKELKVILEEVAAPVKKGEEDSQKNIFLMEEKKDGVGQNAEISGIGQCK